MREKALQIGGLVLFIALFSAIDIFGYSSAPKGLTPLDIILLGFSIIALNTMFVFFGFSIISDIKETNREINQLEKELEKGDKGQDSE